MTYNLTKNAVRRMRRYLEDLAAAKRDLTWPSHEPKSLAYRIREAMVAAQAFEEFEMFHELKANYSIGARNGWVEAKFKGTGGVEEYDRQEVFTPERVVVDEVRDAHGMVGAAMQLEMRANEIYFPKAILNGREKLIVYRWTQTDDVKWKFIDQSVEGSTLTRKKVDRILLWEPPEEE